MVNSLSNYFNVTVMHACCVFFFFYFRLLVRTKYSSGKRSKGPAIMIQNCNESETNVSVSAGLNEATCYKIPALMLHCKAQTSQC